MTDGHRELSAVMEIIDGVCTYADPEPEVRTSRVIGHLRNEALLGCKHAERAEKALAVERKKNVEFRALLSLAVRHRWPGGEE